MTIPSARKPVTAKAIATRWSPKVFIKAFRGCEGYILTPSSRSSHLTPIAVRLLTIADILSHSCPLMWATPTISVGSEK